MLWRFRFKILPRQVSTPLSRDDPALICSYISTTTSTAPASALGLGYKYANYRLIYARSLGVYATDQAVA